MTTTTTTTTPRLYVGTYAKYAAGSLKGAWLDLADYTDRDAFLEACAALHADESDPEFMFQDFEGFPEAWYSESSAPGTILWEWLELSEDEQLAFGAYASNFPGDQVTIDDFRDAYQGQWDYPAEFAQHIAEECGEIPADLPAWIVIDWEASWNCNLRHDYFEARDTHGQLHIFSNN